MGMLDRMMGKGLNPNSDPSTEDSTSTTPAPADAPVYDRIRRVVNYMTANGMKASGGDAGNKRSLFIVSKLVEEVINDLHDVPPEIVEMYMTQISRLLYWASTGIVPEGDELPEGL